MRKKLVTNSNKKATPENLDSKINNLTHTLESLAISVTKGFLGVNKRLDSLEQNFEDFSILTAKNFGRLENKIDDIDDRLQATRNDISNLGDRTVKKTEFDNLVFRVTKLEKKK
jgi:tetrahydromethanopterin S-methyltransferase subunit G